MNIDEIHDLKEHYINELYSTVRREQEIDLSYRNDTFDVPEIRAPHKIWRSGIGSRMVDAPAEQIVTSNPQAFFKGNAEVSLRLSEEVNQNWIDLLRRQNPNPFKESLKNKLARGENYIHVLHNEAWVTGAKLRRGMPVLFVIHDPMVIYGSPEEDDCGWIPNIGIPNQVIVFYKRQPRDVIQSFDKWTNPNKAKQERDNDKVEWFEYWDKDIRYFEADGEAVLEGKIQPNPYGFVPFVRKYSGFGRRSAEGKLEDLIVSEIRLSRDLIRQECITRSNIASIEHIFAHKPKTIISEGQINEKDLNEIDWGAYSLNVLSNVPAGTKFIEDKYDTPPPEMYMNHNNIKSEIAQRNPFIIAGFPSGSSGRQQDMTQLAAMRRFDTVIENTETGWAIAFEMALQICDKIPTLKPDGLRKADLSSKFHCEVKLKASDPIEEDRLITLGDRLRKSPDPAIDLGTFHTQFMGYTQEKSKETIANILVDQLTIYNPDVAEVMGMVFAEESGMGKFIEEARQKRMMMEEQQKGLQDMPPRTTQERTQGEVKTPLGKEMMDMALSNKGARRPPTRYSRG